MKTHVLGCFGPLGESFGNGKVPELAECRDAKKLL
jgi:hypothetical protein